MLAGQRHQPRARRGIVLVLVLAMLGLLALIGVTFATFSGQSLVNARNYAQSVVQPQADELMDFAMQQLITDTSDPRSAIRGHSLAGDMFGNDALYNGYLPIHLTYGGNFYITSWQTNSTGLINLSTNILSNDSNFYGYNFTRWIIKVAYQGTGLTSMTVTSPYQPPDAIPSLSGNATYAPSTVSVGVYPTVYQTLEVIADSGYSSQSSADRVLTVAIVDPYPTNSTGGNTSLTNQVTGVSSTNRINWGYSLPPSGSPPTTNVQPAGASPLPSAYLLSSNQKTQLGTAFPFQLDGRWLHAFNGPGMGPYAYLGNFRYNGGIIAGNPTAAIPGNPTTLGMDEDYDACDLENWFLAIQSADGSVVIPSFHRPGNIRYDLTGPNGVVNDWQRINQDGVNGASVWTSSASRILRPCQADGNDSNTFGDITPDPTTGKLTFDVDNDGDGATDSVWLDLGYPARRDQNGNLYKPLFAFMVIGLNGRIPLNTAGNLAGTGATHAAHLGNSPSEIDMTYALQNYYAPYNPNATPSGDFDPFNSLLSGTVPGATGTWAGPNSSYGQTIIPTYNAQVDNAINAVSGAYSPVDVRLTQLRNILAGTRPFTNPLTPTPAVSTTTGDANVVYGSWGTGVGAPYFMPNGMFDGADTYYYADPSTTPPTLVVAQSTNPVAGRWGEAASIPGLPFNNPSGNAPIYLNLIQSNYANPVRAGYSFDVADLLTNITYSSVPFPRDAADDNYNAFDVYPPRLTGEVGDSDFYDAVGAMVLPVERMRRFVTPADINGTGRVAQFATNSNGGAIARGPDLGADNYGRVQFSSYFRPAGVPGVIATKYAYNSTLSPPSYSAVSGNLGAIYYPTGGTSDPFYLSGPNNGTTGNAVNPAPPATPQFYGEGSVWPLSYPYYLPDQTNNPLHSFEQFKIPNLFQNPGSTASSTYINYNPQQMGGMPIDVNLLTDAEITNLNGSPPNQANGNPYNPPNVPYQYPTYDNRVNSADRSDGVNEADEMNLYAPNPLLDSPYGPSDLEWLYRLQDVDGATLTSRLQNLAPVSFTNTLDGLRRRRLVALDTFETNGFVWTNDNPGNAFANNSSFSSGSLQRTDPGSGLSVNVSNAGFLNYSAARQSVFPTASLAHRDRKINLNYPLPVSNDCNEPVRQKWISETYQLLKVILPPDSVDTAEELAQLSQFVINIIDFRDPDATMTHWINPDVVLTPSTLSTSYPTLTRYIGNGNLDQYGMEYNPVAINEVLAYSFQSRPSSSTNQYKSVTQTNRFFIELVNTLTAAYNPLYNYGTTTDINNYYANQASCVNLGGFNYISPTGASNQSDPYGGGCWDLVFTNDTGWGRPDPFRGELIYNPNVTAANATYFGLVPLTRDAFQNSPPGTTYTVTQNGASVTEYGNKNAPNGGDPTLLPISPNPPGNANLTSTSPIALPVGSAQPSANGSLTPAAPPINYFYVIANPTSGQEANPLGTTASGSQSAPPISQFLSAQYDPFSANGTGPSIVWRQGILPGPVQSSASPDVPTSPPANFAWDVPPLGLPQQPTGGASPSANSAQFLWVCLRRPANPFAPVSASNPMCVVDSMRFPYIDGSANVSGWSNPTSTAWTVSGTTANTIYSAQRLQPYRGGHAVPLPNITSNGTSTTTIPPDSRYGYTEQLCVPEDANTTTNGNTTTIFNTTGYANLAAAGSNAAGAASTNYISYHTLGLPNSAAENWDYFVFNDRDFTSVAELLLVPGCPPGLFTKQFAEFAPSQINAVNIFSNVTPMLSPVLDSATYSGTDVSSTTLTTAFKTATAPFYSVSQATRTPTAVTSANYQAPTGPPTVSTFRNLSSTNQPSTAINPPVQPHTFPYLIDKFFYTGASTFFYPPTGAATDPSFTGNNVVGGPGGDGWFKMFEFLEVPSQAIGAIGPVAQGNNFDWLRNDIKPGLMNLNLIIDEEAFFSVFGRQNSSFTQTLLNGLQLPNWPSVPPYLLPAVNPKQQLPLTNVVNGSGVPQAPIPAGWSPIPLVVTALQATGAPNYVYPLPNVGYLANNDPIQQAININLYGGSTYIPPGVGNRMKAAFAQFLWLRHGGSGYLFGYGSGVAGSNSAVVTPNASINTLTVPADRPFRSLSFPDIDYTIMRPAALPPEPLSATIAPYSNPSLAPNVSPINAVTNAAALLYTPTTPPTSGWYFLYASFTNPITGTPSSEPNFYAPYVPGNSYFTNGTGSMPIVYSGDPGVRNPFLNQGYASSDPTITPPYTINNAPAAASANNNNTMPGGVPLPSNVAWPSVSQGLASVSMDGVAMPPPIPPVRLFQVPDAYGAGSMTFYGYDGNVNVPLLPPPVSNATDSGDPWINNQVAYTPTQALPTVSTYALNNGFPSLIWPWMAGVYNGNPGNGANPIMTAAGALYNSNSGQTTPPPPNPATGVLPLIQPAGAPTSAPVNTNVTPNNSLANLQSLGTSTGGTVTTAPYLGANSYLNAGTGLQASLNATGTDDRQHPYWRSEQLQRAMNLTTVRTHQYAVWITIGFFEVKRQGDIGMLSQGAPQLAFDIMGPEVGALNGSTVRYRSFFLVDRLQLTGFNSGAVGAFHSAITYRRDIQ